MISWGDNKGKTRSNPCIGLKREEFKEHKVNGGSCKTCPRNSLLRQTLSNVCIFPEKSCIVWMRSLKMNCFYVTR